jgi:hypothetical protein
VSQNVSYTASIILKRAVKAKIDLGVLLMVCLYMPVVFTLVQSVTCKSSIPLPFLLLLDLIVFHSRFLLTVITDWNDTTAALFRRDVNFFVPCYFQALPPYRQQQLPSSTCPVAGLSSESQPLLSIRPNGIYIFIYKYLFIGSILMFRI